MRTPSAVSPEPVIAGLDTLADTNILLRLAQRDHPLRPVAESAVDRLTDAGAALFVVPQNVVESWGRATRPSAENGVGLSLEQADRAVERFLLSFALLRDGPEIHDVWRDLVRTVGVRGAQVHDARLAACMKVHGLTRILTFNGRDFARYPDIEVIDPHSLGSP